MINIEVNINGEDYRLEVEDDLRLIDLLRDKLHLTGTKEGCGEGECGACTVILDGKSVNSCLLLVAQVHGKRITTIEGLGDENNLHPIQRAFLEQGAVQCGYCIPGMVLSAKAFLDTNSTPKREEIREAISGNLCRCTGYEKIIDSIERASEFMQEEGSEARE
ncbi:(2Fe-2S)-binding protein [Anaeromicrobium sediminis]|uniref:(2Fe-2S)-binding protein n=1 Tax=Anaeromicrobium sediminis TaxID=1478221 RepID=A0A267MLH7_9FIRM|nr:(2Fe-2S)-binding protein [Anaeromicrobium sediminis]PAB59735.1 (2Fe-2S)-binding protein [Anaeromicrobium sediminis]